MKRSRGRPTVHHELSQCKDDNNKYFAEYMKLKFYCQFCEKNLTMGTKYKHLKRACHIANVAKAEKQENVG
jgi:hypothetical protein